MTNANSDPALPITELTGGANADQLQAIGQQALSAKNSLNTAGYGPHLAIPRALEDAVGLDRSVSLSSLPDLYAIEGERGRWNIAGKLSILTYQDGPHEGPYTHQVMTWRMTSGISPGVRETLLVEPGIYVYEYGDRNERYGQRIETAISLTRTEVEEDPNGGKPKEISVSKYLIDRRGNVSLTSDLLNPYGDEPWTYPYEKDHPVSTSLLKYLESQLKGDGSEPFPDYEKWAKEQSATEAA